MTQSRLSRRHFLKRTAGTAVAGALAPAFVRAAALGGEGRVPPSDRITVGMIGAGRQAYLVSLKQFLGMGDVQVVAVSDVDRWRMDHMKQAIEQSYGDAARSGTYKGCDLHLDFRELLARTDIDAVLISTPDHWHAPMAVAAMQAGKDVSLEKPITRTIAEGRQLSDLSRQLGRIFRVDSEFRSQRCVHQAATVVQNGLIGEIRSVTVGVPASDVPCPPQPEMPVPEELDYERWQGPAPRAPYTLNRVHPPKDVRGRPGWMRHLYYCDGMITNWGTHMNDGAMWATGLERTGPVEIEGRGSYPSQESFWNVLLNFEIKYRFANGVEWIYRAEKPYFKIEGSEGWVWADFRELKAEPESLLTWKPGPNGKVLRLKSDKQDFIDSVKSREETLQPAEVGHRVTSLCHLGHIAIQTGRKLTWDPVAERFANDSEADALIDKPIHQPRYA
jgi:myo-inositol 2-dehydrogenase / D-chiro-inositol 1-dehydrogenase